MTGFNLTVTNLLPSQPGFPGSTWARLWSWRLRLSDTAAVVVAVFGSQFLRFGVASESLDFGGLWGGFSLDYSLLSLMVIALWLFTLSAFESRDVSILGNGGTEFRRLVAASGSAFGSLAIVAYLLKVDVARGFFLLALPIGFALLVMERVLWRWVLVRGRRRGRFCERTLVVGSESSVVPVVEQLLHAPNAGYVVVGACVDSRERGDHVDGLPVPVLGDIRDTLSVVGEVNPDTVLVTNSRWLSPKKLNKLGWALEPDGKNLVLAYSLLDVAGPRLHSRPVSGLPLVRLDQPLRRGRGMYVKRVFDVVTSGALLLVLSPLLVGIAVAIKVSSPGPVLFFQDRVGFRGRPFRMAKFRSMVVDAEDRLAEVLGERDARDPGNEVLFKMEDDPRVTRVGRFLRKYSLDELPQLLNVFVGSMSMVGPRPPLPREVAHFEPEVHRKFLVKPGITGLWQVSGRSNLTWKDSVRLDLFYVEHWSIWGDVKILFKTFRAVAAREGAY